MRVRGDNCSRNASKAGECREQLWKERLKISSDKERTSPRDEKAVLDTRVDEAVSRHQAHLALCRAGCGGRRGRKEVSTQGRTEASSPHIRVFEVRGWLLLMPWSPFQDCSLRVSCARTQRSVSNIGIWQVYNVQYHHEDALCLDG